jgi:phosphoglycolate phosphatase
MAKSLGVAVIAVDYGYTETPVLQLGADRIISNLAELPSVVFQLAGAPARAT